MKLACPRCHQQKPNNPTFVTELNRYVDSEGFVAAKVMCPGCGFTADVRVIQDSPPCSNCGHVDRRLLRGDPRGIVSAPTDPEKVIQALRGSNDNNLPY